MSIKQNVARTIRRVKEERHISIEILAKELDVTKSAVQAYLKGDSNPRADTLELLAEKCGVSMIELVSDPLPGWEQAETMVSAAQVLSALPPEKREACVQHLLAIAAIFAQTE